MPLADDVKDWHRNLTDGERNLLTQIFRFFTQADVEVNNCYMKHYSQVFKPTEVLMMLSAFSNIETVHIAAYSHLLDTIGMPEIEYHRLPEIQGDEGQVRLYAGAFGVVAVRDRQDPGRVWGLHRGLQLFASFAILLNFPRFGKMKGMGQIVTWSVRDESLHCVSVIRLFRTFIQENPDLWTEELRREIYLTCATIVSHEDAFIDLAFEQGPVEGLTAREVKQYIRYIADRRLIRARPERTFSRREEPVAVAGRNAERGRACELLRESCHGIQQGLDRRDVGGGVCRYRRKWTARGRTDAVQVRPR